MITVQELRNQLDKLIAAGHKDLHLIISEDDEGNHYRYLLGNVTTGFLDDGSFYDEEVKAGWVAKGEDTPCNICCIY